MKFSKQKTFALVMSALMLTTGIAGCGKKEENVNSNSNNTNTSSGDPIKKTGEITYPVKSDVTLKYWVDLNTNVSAHSKTLNDTPLAKNLQEQTGIKVEYIHPATGQSKEQFNLMISSGDYPDIIEYNWNGFPGGPEKAIQDKVIIPLNDIVDKYSPNFKKVLSEGKNRDKYVKTDKGNLYNYVFVRGDELLTVFYGPQLRADWLKELNLENPVTIEDWEKVLTAFKDKKGATAPLTLTLDDLSGAFVGAFGTNYGYYQDNGKVKYGPMDPQFKDFITLFSKWYKDGLLDKNFASLDGKAKDANILNNKAGAFMGYGGSSMGTYLNAMKDKDAKFDLVGVSYPVAKKGDPIKFAQKDPNMTTTGMAITTGCKNVELAARFLDYGYGKEGQMTYNFGKEGLTYKMENNYPKYTDEIMNNPDKLSVGQAIAKYARASYNGPFVQRKEYVEQYYKYKQQVAALNTWVKSDALSTKIPPITALPEESSELSKLETELNTYVTETVVKFIMGTEPLSNYDKFVDNLKKLNIEKIIKIKQDALERFNKR